MKGGARMRLIYLPVNMAYVFVFGDTPTRLDNEPMFFHHKATAIAAAKDKGLTVSKGGYVDAHQCKTGDSGCLHSRTGDIVAGPGARRKKGDGLRVVALLFALCGALASQGCATTHVSSSDPYAAIEAAQRASLRAANEAIHDASEDDDMPCDVVAVPAAGAVR